MKPELILIGTSWPFRSGGIATFNERMATAFQEQGYAVTIYTFSLQYPSFLFPGKTQYSDQPKPTNLSIFQKINAINPFNWIRVGREINRKKPTLVLVRYWMPFFGPCFGTILRIVRKNNFSKIICIADNIIPHEKRFFDTLLTSFFIKPIDAFITLSEKVASDAKKFTEKPIKTVVHPLYDHFGEAVNKSIATNYLQLNPNKNYILFFGFIRKYKGLDLLIEALSILKKENYNPLPTLLIAGEFYEGKEKYLSQIATLSLSDHIHLFTHFIPDQDIPYYFGACDFVIQPYKHATQSGVTPLAYHFEKPLLVTNVGALPDMIVSDKTGIVSEPTAIAIAAGIKELYRLGDKHFLTELRSSKEKYSWNKLTNTIIDSIK
ncbi:MAG: glycosyltransferase [Chitinophagaceae bacterium]|nr:glycosyltransferase [Chitinophagaceae bacterium]